MSFFSLDEFNNIGDVLDASGQVNIHDHLARLLANDEKSSFDSADLTGFFDIPISPILK